MEKKKVLGVVAVIVSVVIGTVGYIRSLQEQEIDRRLHKHHTYYLDNENKLIHRNKDCQLFINQILHEEEMSIFDTYQLRRGEGYKFCGECFPNEK